MICLITIANTTAPNSAGTSRLIQAKPLASPTPPHKLRTDPNHPVQSMCSIPKPNTPASHLPSPNVIPVSSCSNFYRLSQIHSTVEREARIQYGYVRNPQMTGITPSVSTRPISGTPSDVDEGTPILPSTQPGIKTELIPFAMTVKATYGWMKSTTSVRCVNRAP